MKTVGIVGGMGPHTTAEFYLKLVRYAKEFNTISLPHILIGSVPINFALEAAVVRGRKSIDGYLPYLVDEARAIERAGADFFVIPCNTVHLLQDKLRSIISLPFVSITESVVDYCLQRRIGSLWLFATSQTLQSGLYDKGLREAGIQVKKPDSPRQAQMDEIILRLLAGQVLQEDRDFLAGLMRTEKDPATHFLLACTDLQLLAPFGQEESVHDTLDILARRTLREMAGPR